MSAAGDQFDVSQIEQLEAAELRSLWKQLKGIHPPKTFTARLMRVALAWEVQVRQSGGESAKVRRGWLKVTGDRSKRSGGRRLGITAVFDPAEGTRILKKWGGTTHEVFVTGNGVMWIGESYSSLSAVARAMTGTNRNGPKFFGLRDGIKS
ncbi:Protein of unknown function [Shimia gijangensis]|uniref:DUF2924 domain-containing protein n=1 Tax=Shimia gijangensis TaxID=1470563 RepID=A0A1M6TL10_9RHOB|nr:DUF2924 domain-containing protein [Shimia gijangensis]SHK57576.1 Protein of unknown function [Shimia gijangensis]